MSETIAVHLSNLIAGEQAYTHALSVCCDHYYKPLLEAQKHLAPAVFRPKDVRALFANAEQLLSTHRRFCEQVFVYFNLHFLFFVLKCFSSLFDVCRLIFTFFNEFLFLISILFV
jgi:hypothetical protein